MPRYSLAQTGNQHLEDLPKVDSMDLEEGTHLWATSDIMEIFNTSRQTIWRNQAKGALKGFAQGPAPSSQKVGGQTWLHTEEQVIEWARAKGWKVDTLPAPSYKNWWGVAQCQNCGRNRWVYREEPASGQRRCHPCYRRMQKRRNRALAAQWNQARRDPEFRAYFEAHRKRKRIIAAPKRKAA